MQPNYYQAENKMAFLKSFIAYYKHVFFLFFFLRPLFITLIILQYVSINLIGVFQCKAVLALTLMGVKIIIL